MTSTSCSEPGALPEAILCKVIHAKSAVSMSLWVVLETRLPASALILFGATADDVTEGDGGVLIDLPPFPAHAVSRLAADRAAIFFTLMRGMIGTPFFIGWGWLPDPKRRILPEYWVPINETNVKPHICLVAETPQG